MSKKFLYGKHLLKRTSLIHQCQPITDDFLERVFFFHDCIHVFEYDNFSSVRIVSFQ